MTRTFAPRGTPIPKDGEKSPGDGVLEQGLVHEVQDTEAGNNARGEAFHAGHQAGNRVQHCQHRSVIHVASPLLSAVVPLPGSPLTGQ